MIKIIPVQEAYKTKIERQQGLAGLRFKSHGSCAYVGADVSPGCYGCFHSDAYYCGFMLGRDFGLPDVCNRNCLYCFAPHRVDDRPAVEEGWRLSEDWRRVIRESALKTRPALGDAPMQYYTFSGNCEPLLYLPVLREVTGFLRGTIDPLMGARGWAKLYTNGTLLGEENILKLKEMGFDEVRVHPAAAGFSPEVYANIRLAVEHIPTVTVETPAWPPHREKLFEMLPIIEDIGVSHLDICQVEITGREQLERIEKALGEVDIYQAYYPMLDDGGLVEDIMREVLDRGYSFSVIDCGGFVKQSRSALNPESFWNLLNRRYPPDWQRHRQGRQIDR